MAHKKGGGSSKNGRESESKRLGVSFSVVSSLRRVTLSFVSAVQYTTQVSTWVWVRTTHFLHWLTVQLASARRHLVSHTLA